MDPGSRSRSLSSGAHSRDPLARLSGTTVSLRIRLFKQPRTRIPATRFRPSLAISLSLLPKRAQGKPGADCARSPVCESATEMHTGLTTGTARTSRLSPRNGFTAYTCSPRGAAFLAPVAGGNAGVAPGSRRQDHTTSPYAAAFSSGVLFGRDPYRKTGFHF